MNYMLKKFMEDNSLEARLIRTIIQGILAVLVVAVPLYFGGIISYPQWASIATAAVMAILSPIMALFKSGNPEDGLEDKEE